MKINIKFAILMAATVLAFASCVTGIEDLTPPPPPTPTVEQAADAAFMTAFQQDNEFCISSGRNLNPMTLPECICTNCEGIVLNYRLDIQNAAWLAFDATDRILSLRSGTLVVPDLGDAKVEATYTCYSSDQSLTSTKALTLNDCDIDGIPNDVELANSHDRLTSDSIGYITPGEEVDTYSPPYDDGTAGRKIPMEDLGEDLKDPADAGEDFDGDGITNLAEYNDDTANPFIAFTNGALSPATGLVGANKIFPVISADFNNDNYNDVAVGTFDCQVSVFIYNPYTGGFDPRVDIPINACAAVTTELLAADFNGDHNMDLFAINSQIGQFSILFGNGWGDFPSISISPGASTDGPAVIADFNGDNDVDVATINGVNLDIYLWDGTKLINTTSIPIGFGGKKVSAADLNNDGIMDLSLLNSLAMRVYTGLGNGDGTFTAVGGFDTGLGSVTNAMLNADFNNDGCIDIGVGNLVANQEFITMLGNCDGTLGAPETHTLTAVIRAIVLADFNGDDIADVAGIDVNNRQISVALGSTVKGGSTVTFENPTLYSTGTTPHADISTTDLGNDHKYDILVTDTESPGNILIFTQ